MAYVDPTSDDLKTRYPAFAAVDDDVVDEALLEASTRVGESWPDVDRSVGVKLYAAHLLASDGLGTSSEAQLAGFKSITVGSLKLERDTGSATVTTDSLLSTSYGRRFAELCSLNFAGPVLV